MPSQRNTFSAHILNTDVEEVEAPKREQSEKLMPTVKTETPSLPEIKPVVSSGSEQPRIRLDYRKTRADKEGKKYINILIDKELQSELKPRMVTRSLTWESLVEGLLRRWLEENPGYKP